MTSLLLIGCGNMGSALLARWIKIASPIYVAEPKNAVQEKTVSPVKQISDVPENFSPDAIVIAVKPQQLDDVLPVLAKKFGTNPTYLSIAAGKTIAYYESHLGQGAAIVRAMPNTPAMIGQGMTALCQNGGVTPEGRALATQLMGAVGQVLWLEDEKLMDAVTALSGSGPAYLYYIIECMIAAGTKHGLSKEAATQLAIETCKGAAMLASQSDLDVQTLRKQVTSPGGTTEAALSVLQKDNALQKLIESAIDAAVQRAQQL